MAGRLVPDLPRGEITEFSDNDQIIIRDPEGGQYKTGWARLSVLANYIATGDISIGIDQVSGLQGDLDGKQPLDSDLTALAAMSSNGQLVRTGSATYATRSLVAPAAGITVTNGDGVSGNPTLALANDLAAYEGLSTTGLVTRTADGAATTRALTGPAAGITVTNGSGVSGNPTLALANDLAAVEGLATTGLARRTGTDTWSAGTQVATAEIADDAVTYAKIQNVSATDRVLGRSTAGAGDVEEIVFTSAARALADDPDAATMRTTLGLTSPATTTPAALTKTDDTNVTLALGGTPATALLQATSLTLGWTGTLAAGRLNSNVVQGVTNDTNITGSITAQNLTFAWSGSLAVARGGTGATDASGARTNLGLAIGTNVQAYDADLSTIAGLASTKGNIIGGTSSGWNVLTVGTDTYVLTADSGSPTGFTWAAPTGGGGGGAPTDAEYIVGALSAGLSAERLGTTTATVAWDFTTSGQAKLNVVDNSISDSKLRQGAALTVIGRSANSTGNVADIAASNDGEVLRRSGTALGFGTIATAGIANDAVTYAKIQNVSATDMVLGRSTAGAGDIEEIAFTSVARTLNAQTSQANMRTTGLGLGTIATQASNSVSITGGSITGITDLVVADGGTGVSTLTSKGILFGNGTSAIGATSAGTAGQVLTSGGAGVDPSWGTPAAGSYVWLASATASNSATIDFTNTVISSTYDEIVFEFENLVPAVDDIFSMRYSTNNGSSYLTSGYSNNVIYYNGTISGSRASSQGQIDLLVTPILTTSALSGAIKFTNPNSTSHRKRVWGTLLPEDGSSPAGNWVSGSNTTTSAVNAVRFFMQSGNISSGKIHAYGIKRS